MYGEHGLYQQWLVPDGRATRDHDGRILREEGAVCRVD